MRKFSLFLCLVCLSGLVCQSLAADIDYNNIIFRNSKGKYFYTRDGGRNWKSLRYTDNPFKNQMFISQDKRIFISNDKGNTWREEKNIEISGDKKSPQLEMKLYPNPANEQSTFKINSGLDCNASVRIYNSLGEKVYDLQGCKLHKGYNEINIDIGSFDPGIYFVRVEAENYVYSGRFIITK